MNFLKYIVVVSIICTQSSYAQDSAKDDLTAILNQLEENLLTEGKTSDYTNFKKPNTKYNTGMSTLDVDPYDNNAIDRIGKLVNELSKRTKELESSVLNTQSSVIRNSKQNTHITLAIDPTIKQNGNIVSLLVKIDGLRIYKQDQSTALWSANRELPIFIGPMEVGSHDVEILAKVKQSKPSALGGLQSTISSLANKFSITVPEGASKIKWVTSVSREKNEWQIKIAKAEIEMKMKKKKTK